MCQCVCVSLGQSVCGDPARGLPSSRVPLLQFTQKHTRPRNHLCQTRIQHRQPVGGPELPRVSARVSARYLPGIFRQIPTDTKKVVWYLPAICQLSASICQISVRSLSARYLSGICPVSAKQIAQIPKVSARYLPAIGRIPGRYQDRYRADTSADTRLYCRYHMFASCFCSVVDAFRAPFCYYSVVLQTVVTTQTVRRI